MFSLRAAISRPMIFPAPKYRFTPSLAGGSIVTAMGTRTAFGYYAPAGSKLVVFFHGNGEVMGSMQDIAALMLKNGFSILMTEYPGYGFASAHETSEQNIYEDTELLLDLMRDKYGHLPKDTILWGFSLGTGVAVEMAVRGRGERIVLMAPFTSVADAAAHHTFFLARWLIADHFDNAAKAARVKLPVLIIHGESDSILPIFMGRKLAQLFAHAEFRGIAGADHNDLLSYIDAPLWKNIAAFAAGFP